MKYLLLLFLLLGTGFYFLINLEDEILVSPIEPLNNIIDKDNLYKDPIQTLIKTKKFQFKEYNFSTRFTYDITARVLSIKEYKNQKFSDISPLDFALGWNEMSKDENIKNIEISQRQRWYFYRAKGKKFLGLNKINLQSANTHILPATTKLEKELKEVKKGDIINLKGYLVSVKSKDNYFWNSSLNRKDTGNGACEVFFITNFSYINQ